METWTILLSLCICVRGVCIDEQQFEEAKTAASLLKAELESSCKGAPELSLQRFAMLTKTRTNSVNESLKYASRLMASKNIVFILADDLGWDDVSFHGSNQIPTPNLDALASSGVILNKQYSLHICTPSRAALLTGIYPYRTGMQYDVLNVDAFRGLPTNFRILPEYLKEQGYSSHIVGKWNLGFSRQKYLPMNRGFDSHFGFLGSGDDYYTHQPVELPLSAGVKDFQVNGTAKDVPGYLTHIFTDRAVNIIEKQDKNVPLFLYLSYNAPHSAADEDPLQAPEETISMFVDVIQNKNRSIYAAMVTEMDQGVGRIVKALSDKGILENTAIVFSSDNGGQYVGHKNNSASNWPLRGQKVTLFEGGTRVSAFAWSADIENPRRTENGLMHFVDWLPTLYRLAGGDPNTLNDIDGIDQWDMISKGSPSKRNEMVYNIDYVSSTAAIRRDGYKAIFGFTKMFEDDEVIHFDGWYPPQGLGGSSDFIEIEDKMDNSTTARALKIAGLWWKDKVALQSNTTQYVNYPPLWAWRNEAIVNCGNRAYIPCDFVNSICLFDVERDPCEMTNIAASHPDIVEELVERIVELSHCQHEYETASADKEIFQNGTFLGPWL